MKQIIITQDDQIVVSGEIIGYIERDVVFVFERNVSKRLGLTDHRTETIKMVEEWLRSRH